MVPRQGEIWWAELEGKRRPVLIVTRSEACDVLRRLVVAPVTKTVRGVATEIPLGEADGLRVECAASFDNLETVLRSLLTSRVGGGTFHRSARICSALSALADCRS
jgi:mRNA interferase MazF